MKAVTASMFKSLRSDLLAYLERNRLKRDVPKSLERNFFDAVFDSFEMVEDAEIIDRGGRPAIRVYQRTDFFGDDFFSQLCIGGVDNIEDEDLRSLVYDFLAAYIGHNPFSNVNGTVWFMLAEDLVSNPVDRFDINDFNELAVEDINEEAQRIVGEKELVDLFFQKLSAHKSVPHAELENRLREFRPHNEKDSALVELLLTGLHYAFEDSWADDRFEDNNYGSASVYVGPYDYFPVSFTDTNLLGAGWDIVNGVWSGDCISDGAVSSYVILPDGNVEEEYDSSGFISFCNLLSTTLNSYLSNSTDRRD